jgi:uncharacterized membrane protein YbaN (DUF454 family)
MREADAQPQAYAPATTETVTPSPRRLVRWSLWLLGTVFVGIGILGIFLPLLPTTVFFLMAAWCYAHSSKRFHHWLHHNRFFGRYLKDYREGRGIKLSSKIFTIALLWASILYSVAFAAESLLVRLVLILVAVAVTVHIFAIPTRKAEE